MSTILGSRVLVYPEDPATGIPPYEAIVETVKYLDNGVVLIHTVVPTVGTGKAIDVSKQVVTFVQSPFGKVVIDWFINLFKRRKKK